MQSAGEASATAAIGRPVAGSSTASVRPSVAATKAPSIRRPVGEMSSAAPSEQWTRASGSPKSEGTSASVRNRRDERGALWAIATDDISCLLVLSGLRKRG